VNWRFLKEQRRWDRTTGTDEPSEAGSDDENVSHVPVATGNT
jgi:hypothetical protein